VVLLLLGPLALLVVCIADEVTNSRFYCWFIVAAYYSVVVFCNYGFPLGFLIAIVYFYCIRVLKGDFFGLRGDAVCMPILFAFCYCLAFAYCTLAVSFSLIGLSGV